MGQPTMTGSFTWYPSGLEGYWKHAEAAHNKSNPTSPKDICGGWCLWLCSICKKEKRWRSRGVMHGGPTKRLLDRRFGLAYCDGSSYPKHKRAYGRGDGARGPVVFYHEGTSNPSQPVQDDPSIVKIERRLTREESVSGDAIKPKGRKPRGESDVPVTRRRTAKASVLE